MALEATVGNSEPQVLYLLRPTQVFNPKAKAAQTVSPFWNAIDARVKGEKHVELTMQKQSFSAGFQVAAKEPSTKVKAKVKAKQPKVCEVVKWKGKTCAKVQLSVPYFTNTFAASRGQTLVYRDDSE